MFLRILTTLALFPLFVFSIQEKDLFPDSNEKYIETYFWYNSKGDLCLMFHHSVIVIDEWHYPQIDNP